MATKKKATGTSMAAWDAQLAALAQKTQALEDTAASGGSKISVRGGAMTFKSLPVPGNKLNCIVLDSIAENAFYEGDFAPDSPANPVCFAFSHDDAGKMAPHELSTKKQHDTCQGCPQNSWGSADTGRGKACKNVRRLILITEDSLKNEDTVASAEAAILSVPVTSTKNWSGYVGQLNSVFKRPPLGVITEISCRPDAKTQVQVEFKMKHNGLIDDGDIIGALIKKQEAVQATLLRPYEPVAEEAAKPAKTKSGKKPAAKARR